MPTHDARRKGADTTAGWFRVGLLSATIITPLIARWSRLRATERAELAAAQANSRWASALAWLAPRANSSLAASRAALQLAQLQAQARLPVLSDRLSSAATSAWNATRETALPATQRAWNQVSQQVSQRAPGAQLALSRVIPAIPAPQAPASTPIAAVNSLALETAQQAADALRRRRRLNSTLWLIGVGAGVAIAGVGAYLILRRRMARMNDEEPLVELPLTPLTATNGAGTNGVYDAQSDGAQQTTLTAAAADDQSATPTATDTATQTPGVEDAAQAAFIGNIHTLVYHEADADDLPAEENRVYFGSEEEAIASGFHRDRNEVAPAASEATQS